MSTWGLNPADAPPKTWFFNPFQQGMSSYPSSLLQYPIVGNPGANTYQKVLDISGPGRIDELVVRSHNVTIKTIGYKIIIDNNTTIESTTTQVGSPAIGIYFVSASTGVLMTQTFNDSIQVWINTSISETAGAGCGIAYTLV